MRFSRLLGIGFIVATFIARASAADLTTTGDTYTQSDSPNSNFGASGITAVAVNRITLIQFDPTAIVQSSGSKATLKIRILVAKNSMNGVSARAITSAWSEKNVTAKTLPSIATTALDQKIITAANQGQVVSFDVSGALSSWRNNPAANFGIALVPDSPTPNLELGSREGGSPAILSLGGVAADNDVTVAISGGDYADAQTAANNAFAGDKWCVSPQLPAKPCTIHVKAGFYPNGVSLPAGLALIGEDRASTILVGGIDLINGLVSDITIQGGVTSDGIGSIEMDRVSIITRDQPEIIDLNHGVGDITFMDSDITSINTLPNVPSFTFDCGEGCQSIKLVHCRISTITQGESEGFVFTNDLGRSIDLEDTSMFISGTQETHVISSGSQGLKVSIVGGQLTSVSSGKNVDSSAISGVEGGESLEVIDATINGGIFWSDSGSVTLAGATVNGGLFAGQPTSADNHTSLPVSVVGTVISGGAGLGEAALDLQSSTILGDLNLSGSKGALSSSQVTGKISLFTDPGRAPPTATCNRVFDGKLALLPANCVSH